MTNEKEQEQIYRAMEIRLKLFDIANSFGGDRTGLVAITLHQACNCILRAKELLEAVNCEHRD